MTERPRIWTRPAQFASDDPRWRALPVEGSAAWKKQQALLRRSARVRRAIFVGVVIGGAAIGYWKG